MSIEPEHLDVVIVGAGLSGIGAAAHLQDRCPSERFVLLEARATLGGTWDLFRYPGIRSDSDMHTLGYAFKPWTGARALADGESIRRYIAETAEERGLLAHIRFNHRLVRAAWSSAEAVWTLEVDAAGERRHFTCRVLDMCSGYYRYDQGYRPQWNGEAGFRGRIVHPQHWPPGLDVAGQRVVVIGSGATAVTLVPALARTAAHVTMLQRSPSYVVSVPAHDRIAVALRSVLPAWLAYRVVRAKNVLMGQAFFQLSRRRPQRVRTWLLRQVARQLPRGFDVARHFSPTYRPWDQRVCLVPDGDLFEVLSSGRASVETATIAGFVADGVQLTDGRTVPADLVVTATGLTLNVLGDVALSVDGRPVDVAQCVAYKGMMLSDVPNLVQTFGYTNASWTLKADLTSAFLCRLLRHMAGTGKPVVVARREPGVPLQPFLDFTSGYVQRALDRLPRQGARAPWRLRQNYLLDLLALRLGRLEDGRLQFEGRSPGVVLRSARAAPDGQPDGDALP